MKSYRAKSKVKSIIIFALLAILTVGVIGIGIKLSKLDTNKSIGGSSFSLGYLNTDGQYCAQDDSHKDSIVSDFIKIDEIKIDLDEENATLDDGVEYKIFYYTEAKVKTGVSASFMKVDYDSSLDTTLQEDGTNESAVYVRIVARYIAQTSVSNVFEKLSLVDKLNITVNK